LRILFVGTGWSPHLARWINQLGATDWDRHLFPLNIDEGVHPELKGVTVHDAIHGRPRGADASVRAVDDFWPHVRDGYPLPRGAMTARRVESLFYPRRADRSWRLAYTIRRLRPDIIHSMTTWPAGDLVADARAHLGNPPDFPIWIASGWGTDIYLFPWLSSYQEKIRRVLSTCDYFTCDCRRDIETPLKFGFRGELLPVFPVTGGLEIEHIRAMRGDTPPSARRLVLLKGGNRVLFAVRALELCADALRGYRVGVYYSADPEVINAVELFGRATGVPFELIPKVSPDEMLRLHGEARVSIGISRGDGLPLSVLEAMAMGSFPVQSNTSCLEEHFTDGVSCLLVHPEDPEAIAAALRRALTEDELVDRAAPLNREIVETRFDSAKLRPRIVEMYEKVFRQGKSVGAGAAAAPATHSE
jgi:glycosyltransferase involved in cell wall biosynthesis